MEALLRVWAGGGWGGAQGTVVDHIFCILRGPGFTSQAGQIPGVGSGAKLRRTASRSWAGLLESCSGGDTSSRLHLGYFCDRFIDLGVLGPVGVVRRSRGQEIQRVYQRGRDSVNAGHVDAMACCKN